MQRPTLPALKRMVERPAIQLVCDNIVTHRCSINLIPKQAGIADPGKTMLDIRAGLSLDEPLTPAETPYGFPGLYDDPGLSELFLIPLGRLAGVARAVAADQHQQGKDS